MLSKRTKQWKTSLAAMGMMSVMLGSAPAWAGDPTSATYCQENDRIFWFMTITDTHIGTSGSQDTDNLSWIVHEGKNVVNPSFIVLAGDITDSTNGNILLFSNGPYQSEWDLYRTTLDMANTGINAGNFFDIPGNHDAYNDADFSYYLNNSVQGQATGRTQASWTHNLGNSKYHFLGVNTSANDGRKFSLFSPYGDYAGLDSAELTYIGSELALHSDADLTLIFGHHPIEHIVGHDTDTWIFYGASDLAVLLDGYGISSYTYGHTHRFSETFFTQGIDDKTATPYSIDPGVFYININSLGESNDYHFNVTAIDCNGISMVTQAIKRWPVVMITTPMDRNLGKNAHPLLGYTVPNGTGNPLRALLFDPNTSVCTAEYRIDSSATWYPMSSVVTNPNLWEASWDSSGLNKGEHSIEVRATGSEGTVRTDTIAVYVEAGTTNEPPVANATATPLSGTAPLNVDFNGTASTDDGEIVTYLWDFGDNSTGNGVTPTHTYPDEGTYSVTLTVTDNEGAQDTSSPITINVEEGSTEPYIDQFVSGEILVSGTVSGSFSDTKVLNEVYETITERVSGGKPSNRYNYLEHIWTIPVESGTTMTLFAQLLPSNSTDGDEFEFAYSTDNNNYITMFTTSGSSAMEYSANLSADISGTLYIRVTDTDRTPGNNVLDSIAVDQLYVRTGFEAGEVPVAPTGLMATATSSSQIELSWSDNSDNETGFKIDRFDADSWVEAGRVGANISTYIDTGLLSATAYIYRIIAYNGSGNSALSNEAIATTEAGAGITLSVQTSKVRGSYFADLEWSGATTQSVDIYKDGSKLTSVSVSSNTYSDPLGKKPVGNYVYKVCEEGTTTDCSDEVVISF